MMLISMFRLDAHLNLTPTLNVRNPKFEPDLTPRRSRVYSKRARHPSALMCACKYH
jgi:hypothetical protein